MTARRRRRARRIPFAARNRNARADTLDFRDRMFVPTLIDVPERLTLDDYRRRYRRHLRGARPRILDQETTPACTGFALAAVVHYLLHTRAIDPDRTAVSPEMLYVMARRYDEWRGETYDGSSARGAMKAWHKHGAVSCDAWEALPRRRPDVPPVLDDACARDALQRPLGAYFRVNHRDLVGMHTALAEVGILYATALVHPGWDRPAARSGVIPFEAPVDGGHAFAIVGYDDRGFWIQNSWGADWGLQGFALLPYDDWLQHGTDVWVARLGVPITPARRGVATSARGTWVTQEAAYAQADLRAHIISTGNDGRLRIDGRFGTGADDVRTIVHDDLARTLRGWKNRRVVLYAHGGLVGEDAAVQRIADYREALLQHEVYPIALVWNSDFLSTAANILRDAFSSRRAAGPLESAKDFLLDRIDDSLEPLARLAGGRAMWSEMKENAAQATTHPQGGVRLLLAELATLARDTPFDLHLVGHSAGSVLLAPVVSWWTGAAPEAAAGNRLVKSCALWAPACTMALFRSAYLPAIRSQRLARFSLFTLSDEAERNDHVAHLYHKSLLYLVSNAFETRARLPFVRDGEPLLGMAKFVEPDRTLQRLFRGRNAQWIVAPNDGSRGARWHSTALHHARFDDDVPTLRASLSRIVGRNVRDPIVLSEPPPPAGARRAFAD